jgi:hypothetical protein
VWAAAIESVTSEYPALRVQDKANRRIETCWRMTERSATGEALAAYWKVYKLTLTISAGPPWAIAIDGRGGEVRSPQVIPYQHGDIDEPYWVEGRTDKMYTLIYDRLKPFAVQDRGGGSPNVGEVKPENFDETCIIGKDGMVIRDAASDTTLGGNPGRR